MLNMLLPSEVIIAFMNRMCEEFCVSKEQSDTLRVMVEKMCKFHSDSEQDSEVVQFLHHLFLGYLSFFYLVHQQPQSYQQQHKESASENTEQFEWTSFTKERTSCHEQILV